MVAQINSYIGLVYNNKEKRIYVDDGEKNVFEVYELDDLDMDNIKELCGVIDLAPIDLPVDVFRNVLETQFKNYIKEKREIPKDNKRLVDVVDNYVYNKIAGVYAVQVVGVSRELERAE